MRTGFFQFVSYMCQISIVIHCIWQEAERVDAKADTCKLFWSRIAADSSPVVFITRAAREWGRKGWWEGGSLFLSLSPFPSPFALPSRVGCPRLEDDWGRVRYCGVWCEIITIQYVGKFRSGNFEWSSTHFWATSLNETIGRLYFARMWQKIRNKSLLSRTLSANRH